MKFLRLQAETLKIQAETHRIQAMVRTWVISGIAVIFSAAALLATALLSE
ncbi:hypothetical protein [Paracoccus aestuariivivens]|uniref:Uncharacterized protein n=1 Tax=Paracoccus aestuariivivens TaxID=1820333 RepID=A0A6L6J2Z2_9RHOB|nr:hypothetical protein [Paracoccus aestuariivivens]MTH76493.1 hypothetical protein [Paracoccus aestuariivivens]